MRYPRIFKYGAVFLLGAYTSIFLQQKPQIPSVKCQKGQQYKVNEVGDVVKLIPDLECLFRGGVTPSKVPVGAMHGDPISMGNEGIGFFRPLATSMWSGKYLSPAVQCEGSTKLHLGWNFALNRVVTVPFQAHIGPLKDVLNISHPSLLDNSKSSLVFQYDLRHLNCPNQVQQGDIKRSPFGKQLYPLHRFVDEIRLVGRQKDGGAILLGRILLRDPFDEPSTSVPFAFFTLISYDKELNPNFSVGQPLPPLSQDTTHLLVDRRDVLITFCSFDDLIKNPPRAISRIMDEIKLISFNLLNAIPDITMDLVSPGEVSQILRTAFETQLTQNL